MSTLTYDEPAPQPTIRDSQRGTGRMRWVATIVDLQGPSRTVAHVVEDYFSHVLRHPRTTQAMEWGETITLRRTWVAD